MYKRQELHSHQISVLLFRVEAYCRKSGCGEPLRLHSFPTRRSSDLNEYSVNLPTKFVYQGKEWDGWINIVNPFRASIVLGTLVSGKSYAVVNNYIRQQIEKSFAMYIYDYKFPDLSEIAYNHLLKHRQHYKVKPEMCIRDRSLQAASWLQKRIFFSCVETFNW